MAVIKNRLDSVRALLGLAANPTLRDAAGRNPLDVATSLSSQRDAIVDALFRSVLTKMWSNITEASFQAAELSLPSPEREENWQ